jgi:AAA15 family ATPase/GTPase
MNAIRITNFGPIRSGFQENGGFVDINKFTVFIGDQGTGKSSIAKLISTLKWLEKSLYRGEISEKYATSYNRFSNTYCSYQNLKSYFSPETEIEYQGESYHISYKDGRLILNAQENADYVVPKIMYVPAERNFLSAIPQPWKLKGLPQSLYTFLEELERSQQELPERLKLPVGDVEFEFDKLNKTSNIVGADYKIRLSEASSGFQSFVPLFLVSRNLALSIDKEGDRSKKAMSSEERQKLQSEIESIFANDHLSEEVKQAALQVLSSKYRNECFVNIVEEIEQNLFPSSQRQILYKLIEFANHTKENQLVLTTHSPYIIDYLTLAIKGSAVRQRISSASNPNVLERLEEIVPAKACISADKIFVYQLTNEGHIEKLPDYNGLPSDENYLNSSLSETNQWFSDLIDIGNDL